MNTFKRFLLASAALLPLATPTFADVTVRMTGSTAFRAAATLAIRDMYGASLTGYAFSGTTLAGSNDHIFRGTIPGKAALGIVTVKCSWSGSNEGMRTLTLGLSRTFMATATDTPAGTAVLTVGGNPSQSVNGESTTSDITMMDTLQSATPYQSPPIIDEKVGVLPFTWVIGRGAPAGITNMTAQLARQLYAAGFHSASAWTGDDADAPVDSMGATQPAGTVVYAGGRDTGSGTRNLALTETGIGGVSTIVQMFTQASVRVATTASNTALTVDPLDQPSLSLNMIGKTITGGSIPGSTTVTGVTATTITISNPAGSTAASVSALIGPAIGATPATALFFTREGGNQGHSSGGTLADMLRVDCSAITDDAYGNQTGAAYSGKACFMGYLGLSDADRAVNGTGSGISQGSIPVADRPRFIDYEGVSIIGGVAASLSVDQDPADTVLSVTAGSTVGIIPGQLMKGTGITPGTTVVSTTAGTVTLSKPTSNVALITGNPVGATQFLPKNVRNGKYSYWAYQRVGYLAALLSNADKKSVKESYVLQLTGSSIDLGATSAIPDDDEMRFARSAEGGPIGQKF